jgi:hypothetical protein
MYRLWTMIDQVDGPKAFPLPVSAGEWVASFPEKKCSNN